jgi:Coenzyme PQQ synthesis protein D (PqqD)
VANQNWTSRFTPSPDVVFRRVGDDGFLVDLTTNRMYQTNETLTRFWELMSAGTDRAEIARIMLEEFDVSEQRLQVEIEQILARFKTEALLAQSNEN